MPVDRFGNPIRVGFSPTEDEWLKAANTLHGSARFAAFRDIAEMSGRTFAQIRDKANHMRRPDNKLKGEILAKTYEWRLGATQLVAHGRPGLRPSELQQPTKAALMGSR